MSNSPAPTDVPPSFQILTPRLIIRPATTTPADLPALLDHFTNPAATSEPQTTLTEEVLAQRIEKWAAMRAEGRNAWLIIRLREDGGGEEGRLIGFGGYNAFPRTKMMNSAERKGDAEEEGAEKVLAGDLGVAIDARYQRMGYAREALCGMIEHAFDILQCGYVHLDTQHENTALRAVMRDMGLPEKEGCGEEHEDALFGFAWKSLNYDFDAGMWERSRAALRRRGKWPL